MKRLISFLFIIFFSFTLSSCELRKASTTTPSDTQPTETPPSTTIQPTPSTPPTTSVPPSTSEPDPEVPPSYTTDIKEDPYVGMSSAEFYSSYEESTNYYDAMYRTEHGFMSGSILDEDRYYLPTEYSLSTNYKVSDTNYFYLDNGDLAGYLITYADGTFDPIFYGAAYIGLNEVCAYIYAFGEVPPNSNYDKSDKGSAVREWGKYGRVNRNYYSNNTSKYPYEPELPTVSEKYGIKYEYIETDFGSTGGFTVGGRKQSEYNNGSSINRGTCRIVFTSNAKDASDRHVFYTYNHYNDFQEYLNYGNGFGIRFGNESNGGIYNQGKNPSPYVKANDVTMSELRKMLGYV